jgi:tetratricopeptide (TPR) repeat protein
MVRVMDRAQPTGNEPVSSERDPAAQSPGLLTDDLEALRHQVELGRAGASSGSVADQHSYAVALRRYLNAALGRVELEALRRLADDELIPLADALEDALERARAFRVRAAIYLREGDSSAALEILEALVMPLVAEDDAERAATFGDAADIFELRSEFVEALRIRRVEQLPLYERLGAARDQAVTLGKIADILQTSGELDEALRIRREDQLPIYEQLGAERSRAVTLGKIADILQARGEFAEALRIRREDELPVYERLGAVRDKAVALGKIADVLHAEGELDEALRIRREDELPVYERLGAVREQTVTLAQIADLLQARGELDDALRIDREQVLPILERHGGPDLVVALANASTRLIQRGGPADLDEARSHIERAARMAQALRMGFPELLLAWLEENPGQPTS